MNSRSADDVGKNAGSADMGNVKAGVVYAKGTEVTFKMAQYSSLSRKSAMCMVLIPS